jgi:hypothetical protein
VAGWFLAVSSISVQKELSIAQAASPLDYSCRRRESHQGGCRFCANLAGARSNMPMKTIY